MNLSFKVDTLFEKKFTFNSDGFTKLDSIDGHYLSSPLWEFIEGSDFMKDLDEIRSKLDDKDLISWGVHTARTDLASFVMQELRRRIPNISFELFTRAWCKLMEILITFPVINLNSETISTNGVNSFFLCEAPGAFVHSVNYFIKSERPGTIFNWMATTMNPYYEQADMIKVTIGDDRFIGCKSTYGNWFFGEDDRGDLLDLETIKQICDKFKDSQADLITGDGGINCIDDPEKQEQLSFPLIYHQFITAINCLKPGGSFILKVFTLFSSQSLSLVYLINNLFTQVNCFKPVMSKSGSSEIYLVCIKLLDGKTNLIESITSQYFDKFRVNCDILSISSLLDQDTIPSSFVQQFINCSKQFKDYQKETISSNLDLFTRPDRERIYSSLNRIKKNVAYIYTTRTYPLKLTSEQFDYENDYVVQKFNCFNYFNNLLSNLVLSRESYVKRKTQMGIIPKEKISIVLTGLYARREVESLIKSWTKIIHSGSPPTIKMKFGKPFTKITNSRFIDNNLLYIYNLVTSIDGQSKKTHELNSSEPLVLQLEKTRDRVNYIIRSSLKAVETKFSHIIAPRSSLIVGPIAKVLSEMQIDPKLISNPKHLDFGSLHNRNIIIIDPFDYITNLDNCGDFLSIIEQEQHLIEKIVDQLIDYLQYAKSSDLLAIHSCSLLSRLMIELIFILTTLFKETSIVPNFISNHQFEGNKHLQLGLLILFTNMGRQLTEFTDDLKMEIISTLKAIKIALYETRESDKTLLEIFPIIEILTNISFREFIFTGNFVQLTEKMESLLQN